ncbi:MAG: hypothetical protein WAK95_18970 [Desulfobacterales bacterium]
METAQKKLTHTLIDLETASPAIRRNSGRPSRNDRRDQRKEDACPRADGSIETPGDGKRVTLTRAFLVNKLNFINFSSRTVILKFKHTRFDRTLTLNLTPLPCRGERLDLQWPPENRFIQKLEAYVFDSLLITDGRMLIRAAAEVICMHPTGISLRLPEVCQQVSNRKLRRFGARQVEAQMVQSSSVYHGRLLDFNAVTFRVEVSPGARQVFEWINPESPVNLILSEGGDTYYSGECKILCHRRLNSMRHYVLEPISREIHRYRQKEYRSERLEINPSPDICFSHPLTKKQLALKVVDLSGSGFSVEEDETNAQLLTGLTLPAVQVRFSNNVSVHCKVQVVHRRVCSAGNKGAWVKCGLAILDMDMENNVKLLSLLHQAKNRYSYICNKVDLELLWEFFFETGFIYPDKYVYIEAHKERIKTIYEKLYTRSPGIARHFIYQEKGNILGHMAMVRFYEDAWLIHHHAARKSALNKAGLIVLKQIGRFINDSYRLNAIHLKYVIMYYRPNNRFPNRVFGGACQHIADPQCCSIDAFAYVHLPAAPVGPLPEPWELKPVQPEDLAELRDFYAYDSGGLMVDALDLNPDLSGRSELEEEYRRLGFKKEKHIVALKAGGQLKAIILVNVTDFGFNLSNLTNCIKFIVVDANGLTGEIFKKAISGINEKYPFEELTVLVNPVSYVESIQLPYEKIYNMWVMNTRFSDLYFRYLKRLLKHIH